MDNPDNEIPDGIPSRLDGNYRWSWTCGHCAHYDPSKKGVCPAFPEGIPRVIWQSAHGHRTPYSGDGGIVFEQRIEPEIPPGGYEIPDFLKCGK